MVRKGIFWDRDGIINELVDHNGQYTAPWNISEFRFKPYIKQAIHKAKTLGFYNFVITNQPDVKDGKLPESHLLLMNRMIMQWLDVDSIHNSLVRNTPHYKPNPQMVEDIIEQYELSKDRCYMIGDTWKDIVCGSRAGINTIFVGDKYICPDARFIHVKPNNIVGSTTEAILLIEEIEQYDQNICRYS